MIGEPNMTLAILAEVAGVIDVKPRIIFERQ